MGDILQPPGHPISYFPKLAKVTGSVKAAILAQQISYWTPRAHDAEGWIYKTQTEWMDETGFTLKEFRGACEELEARKLIRKEYDRPQHELRIQLQIDAYNLALQGIKENRAPAKRAHAKKAYAKRAHAKREGGTFQKGTWHVPKGHFVINEAETTTEITTETTTPFIPQTGDVTSPPPSGGNVENVPRTPKEYADYPGFCELWEMAIIRPTGSKGVKQEALDAWKKYRIETTPSLLSRVLDAYAFQKTTRKWQENGGEYVKELHRWVKGKLWEGVTVPEGFDRARASPIPLGFDPNGHFAREVRKLEEQEAVERERRRATD